MAPKFSIIIPVYNVAPYLRECLDSVLAQTFTDWEAICVDDGSSDGSSTILDAYAARDQRITVIHKKNEGVSVARNTALTAASGEYLVFVDGDDYISDDYLRLLSEIIDRENYPQVIHWTGYRALLNDGTVKDCQLAIGPSGESGRARFMDSIIRNSSLWLFVVLRKDFEAIRFPAGVRYGEDDVYFFRMIPFVQTCAEIHGLAYVYRSERQGAASRILTCSDMSLLLHYLRNELLMRSDCNCMIERFARRFVHKCVMRVRRMDCRNGSASLHKELRMCLHCLPDFYSVFSPWHKVWVCFYVKYGRWLVSDIMSPIERAMSLTLFCVRYVARRFSFNNRSDK